MDNKVNEPIAQYGKIYTYADYLKWEVEERIEILRGKIFKMSPAPATTHQSVSRELSGVFYNYFKGKDCQWFVAPFDVRLKGSKTNPKDEDITTVFQPDICVVCDESKLDQRGCLGTPDLIVEILSPSTSKKDITIKYDIYEENGVQEYWIVDYRNKSVIRYDNIDGIFVGSRMFTEDDTVPSRLFPDLHVPLFDVFNS